MEGNIETDHQRMARELRAWAEASVQKLEDAFALAELPPLVGAGRITITPEGIHVELGGVSVRTVLALSDFVLAHARCLGRVQQGEIVPTGLAELPYVRCELDAE
ncbi:hypothetical protein [Kitasatospora sp. NBC_01266]|uniref:hypothetical protein n=1 Tax=Kitasatospora sp. NBC_01266 TaxID=2903572 RepID=UPI002E362C17|nr:hypothetical protein [Kitasatospora sp. NBC_01266]